MMMFMPAMIMCSLLLMLMKHPLSCGMILLSQTILAALMTGMMNYNYWYSYILFLIMVGGMLILFIYMTSIASNEKFKFNIKMLMIFNIMLFLMLLMFIMDHFYWNMINQIFESKNMNLNYNNSMSLMKYFNMPNSLTMIIMIIYLFITLIAVVKITHISYGPLRQKF